MKAKKFRKKPVIIKAIQYTGDNIQDIVNFCGDRIIPFTNEDKSLTIHTLEGDMVARINDFVIEGVNSELYPCNEQIFWKTYEEV